MPEFNESCAIARKPSGKQTVSVVIPVWNDAVSLRILLQHLSTEPDSVEIIVVDRGSADEVEEVASSFTRVRLLSSHPGRGRQMNAGAQAASGDTLLFLHSDTLPPPGAISELPNLLRSRGADFGAFRVRFDPPCFLPQLLAIFTRFAAYWTCFGDQAIFVNRQFFQATGGFPEIPILEEVHWLRRAAKLGRMARSYQAVVTSSRRFQESGQVRQTLRNGWILLLDRIGVEPDRLADIYSNTRWMARRPKASQASAVPPAATGLTEEHPSDEEPKA